MGLEIAESRPSLEELPTQSPLELTLDLTHLAEDTSFMLIADDFLRLEDRLYRGGRPLTAEHKLAFLIGGDSEDVRRAVDMDGNPIYTKHADHAKPAEFAEALHAISDHLESERNLPKVLSEIADVYYNIIQLSVLDPEFRDVYRTCMQRLSDNLGLTLHQAALLVIAKYKHRLIDNNGKKDIPGELAVVARLLNEGEGDGPLIPTPSDEQLDEAFNTIGEMKNTIFKPRLIQWRTLERWRREGLGGSIQLTN